MNKAEELRDLATNESKRLAEEFKESEVYKNIVGACRYPATLGHRKMMVDVDWWFNNDEKILAKLLNSLHDDGFTTALISGTELEISW